eukprot:354264-Chlamydomonas_euryale.AAC.2
MLQQQADLLPRSKFDLGFRVDSKPFPPHAYHLTGPSGRPLPPPRALFKLAAATVPGRPTHNKPLLRCPCPTLYLEEGLRVTKLSFIGYSLGGLISRYAVGILYARGWLAGGSGGGVEPVNFVTVAAPHIGAYRQVTG